MLVDALPTASLLPVSASAEPWLETSATCWETRLQNPVPRPIPSPKGTGPPPAPPFTWVTDPSATLPVAAASPVVMVAVPLETLEGPPMTTPTPRRPPVTFWVVEATLVDWFPTAELPPVVASAVPELLTEPLWKPASRGRPHRSPG
ncbi:MAG: hypothetical protein LC708_00615 [Actinobacteria bacterium]|nr:hypothetical protein [Actinomycetota bacterium]